MDSEYDKQPRAAAVIADVSLLDVLRRIAQSAMQLAHARYAALGVLGPDRRIAELVSIGADGNVQESALDSQTGEGISVPIRVRGEVFGNLYLTERIDGAQFTEKDEQAVDALAAAAAIAVESARLLEQSRRRERWLTATTEIAESLMSGGSAHDTLQLVAGLARRVADAQLVAIALRAEDAEQLVVEVADGPGVQNLIGRAVQTETAAFGEVLRSGQPQLIDETAVESGAEAEVLISSNGRGPAALIPLTAGGHVLGVLSVARPKGATAFDADEVALLTTFAVHAALTLEYRRAQHDRELLAVYEDRDRIARDLHDLVVQRLFAVGLGLQGASRMIAHAGTAERIAGFVRDLDDTITEVRRTIFALQQHTLPSISLRTEVLLEVTEARSSLSFEPYVLFDGPLDAMAADAVRIDIIAALREALSNLAQHAQASSAEVLVQADPRDGYLRLQVTDDGVGIGDDVDRHGGLDNLRERATRHGGELAVTRQDGGGTKLVWRVPARPASPEGPGA